MKECPSVLQCPVSTGTVGLSTVCQCVTRRNMYCFLDWCTVCWCMGHGRLPAVQLGQFGEHHTLRNYENPH